MNEFVRDGCNGILVSVEAYKGRPDGYFWAESICDERRLAVAMQYYIDNREMVAIHGAAGASNCGERAFVGKERGMPRRLDIETEKAFTEYGRGFRGTREDSSEVRPPDKSDASTEDSDGRRNAPSSTSRCDQEPRCRPDFRIENKVMARWATRTWSSR